MSFGLDLVISISQCLPHCFEHFATFSLYYPLVFTLLKFIIFVSETLSPVFPFYDIFRFNIKINEVPKTKVLISLFDYDPDKEDDSLGEVVIDLGEVDFFNKIVTKWFTVQPMVRYFVRRL